MKTGISKIVLLFAIVISFIANSCTDLTVENLNDPTLFKVFSTNEDLQIYAGSAFRTLHNAMQEYDSPALAMNTMADQTTSGWATAGQAVLSSEPRKGFTNSNKFSWWPIYFSFWVDCYESISMVNDILRIIEVENNRINQN